MRTPAVVTFAICLVASSAYAQGNTSVAGACNGRDVSFECSSGACELVVEIIGKPGCRLRIDDEWLSAHNRPRITEATTLVVKVIGANLLRYGLKFETKEKVVDSYVDLERLWRQVLTLAPEPRMRDADSEFVTVVKAWRAALIKHDSAVIGFVAGFRELILVCGERETIREEVSKVKAGRVNAFETT